ncbi:hypothetical protein [Massilia sp. Se16.2.3]|uniref:hypothetical protein n=1 Tax=Massilia sp. Se16.2.3 TaxID=2709303 RepID=UPI001E363659|nr:hypothetical protein [Massilia sp. Se16.2.3]
MWTWSLKCTLRSLLRTLLRGLWARILLPGLLANERSAVRLNESIARRARRLGVQVDGDGTRLCHADRGAPLLTKHALRQHPERFVRPRGPGSLLRNTIRTSGTSGTPLTPVQAWSAVIREEAFSPAPAALDRLAPGRTPRLDSRRYRLPRASGRWPLLVP